MGTLFFRTSIGKPFFICLSTVPNFEDDFAHNMWNPLLDLLSLSLEQTSSVFGLYIEEVELAKIALSCNFVLDLLCCKEGAYDSA